MSNFKNGQKVICITHFERVDAFGNPRQDEMYPIVDKTYTISMVCADNYICLLELPDHNSYDGKKFSPLNESFAEETEAMVQKYATDIEEFLETVKESELLEHNYQYK